MNLHATPRKVMKIQTLLHEVLGLGRQPNELQ